MPFYILIGLLATACLIATLFLSALVFAVFQGAPFVSTTPHRLQTILKFAAIKPGAKVVDLGSGKGHVVIAAAYEGAEAHGYEVNPWLVVWSRWMIRREGLQGKAFIHWQSFWNVSLKEFDTIIVYGIPYIMDRLEEKLRTDTKKGATIISNAFPLPHHKPETEHDSIFYYRL